MALWKSLALVLLAAAPARAASAAAPAKSWEELLKDALRPKDLGTLVEPLFAQCAKQSDLAFRQCETIKNWHLERLRTQRFVALADRAALQPAPYDASGKNVTVTINGCLSCIKPPELGGAPRLLATQSPKAFADGMPVGLDLGIHEIPLGDEKQANRWTTKVLPRLKVEFVFTVGQPFEGKAKGVSIEPIGHRIYNECTGEIVASEPASTRPLKPIGGASCAGYDAPTAEEKADMTEQASLPTRLGREEIEKAMAPVVTRVLECGAGFELTGIAKVQLTIRGGDKNDVRTKILPPFDQGEASVCIRAALKEAVFPKLRRGAAVPVEYPFVFRNEGH